MAVTVITDSAAAAPLQIVRERGLVVVPVWLQVGERSYRDGEIDQQELLARSAEGIKTSGPSPGDFEKALQAAGDEGAVILTVSAAFSATHRAAKVAASAVDVPVRVVDTETAAAAQALVALAALDAAEQGLSLDDVEAAATTARRQVSLVATLEDLGHLVRSGRVPGAAGWVGRKVGLNPIVEFRGGSIRPLRPAFSRASALDRLLARWRATRVEGARLHLAAFHSMDPATAEALLEDVTREHEPASSFLSDFGAAMVAYTGPGVAGLAWRWEAHR